MRKRFIQSHFGHVDLFIAPSRFLLERYVDWGIPRDGILLEDYGRARPSSPEPDVPDRARATASRSSASSPPSRASTCCCEAMALLGDATSTATCAIHGANLERSRSEFQERVRTRCSRRRARRSRSPGPTTTRDLPRLMAEIDWVVVPSIWWENSPLVIQEAFQHGRPVICSDIGGMAEKVTDGVNGLHFRAADHEALARTLGSAAADPALWERLRDGIPPVRSLDAHVNRLTDLYGGLTHVRRRQMELGPRRAAG